MKDRIDNFSHKYISLIEVEERQDAITNREDLGQTICTEEDQGMDTIREVSQDTVLIIGVVMDTI